jgi:hypothetical protein
MVEEGGVTCWNSIVEIVFSKLQRSHATMNKDTVVRFRKKDEVVDPLVELLRNGAHELISRAVEEELRVFLEQQAGRRDAGCGRIMTRCRRGSGERDNP